MTAETGTFTPTDEDVETLARQYNDAAFNLSVFWVNPAARTPAQEEALDMARRWLTAVGPIVERERRAARVEALRDAAQYLRDFCTEYSAAETVDAIADEIEQRE